MIPLRLTRHFDAYYIFIKNEQNIQITEQIMHEMDKNILSNKKKIIQIISLFNNLFRFEVFWSFFIYLRKRTKCPKN